MSSPQQALESFHVRLVEENDLPRAAAITTASFGAHPVEQLRGFGDSPEGRRTWIEQHRHMWDLHFDETGERPAVCCEHIDAATGERHMAGYAEWYLHPGPMGSTCGPAIEYGFAASWVAEPASSQLRDMRKSCRDTFARWCAGRGVGILMYMCVDAAWRRRGAGTACMRWGIRRCEVMGVPAMLMASKDGQPLYERLGFEVVDEIVTFDDGERQAMPLMIRWPPGTSQHDKRVRSQ